ncbi:hypothetical protein D3C73_669730 [compost metagenome]
MQVLDLRLKGVDVAGDLATEGVELSGIGRALDRRRAIVLLAFEHDDVLFQTLDGGARVALLLQSGDVGAEAFQLSVELFIVCRGTFQRGHIADQDFDLGLQLRVHRLVLSALGSDLRQALVQIGGLRGHLRQTFIQVRSLTNHALLLLALVLQLAFQLLDLHLQRFTVAGDVGLAGDNLAGNILQAPRRFLTDARETFLGRHQLLFHQRNLLKAPPGQARESKKQRPDQRPQRTGARRLDLGHRRCTRMHGGASGRRKIIVVEDVCTQARYIIEVVVGIVTHGH